VHAVLWPETALPFTLWPDGTMPKQTMESIRLKAPLITGVVAAERDKQSLRLWNSIAAIDPEGQVVARYAKHQLVPFGEFVPLRSILPLEKITPGDIDFSRGAGPQTVTVPGLPPFSPLVCYEVIFPWIAVDPAHRPEWMLNVTNDGWYGDSPGPYQHFAMARMRAIEQGLPLVRVANNGISAVVDPYGRMGARLALNRRAALDSALPAPLPPTLYARYGEWPALLLLTVALTLGFLPLWLFSVGKGK
jgi:apolipoprotein N-acyltransferase